MVRSTQPPEKVRGAAKEILSIIESGDTEKALNRISAFQGDEPDTRGQQDPAVNVRAAPLGEPSKFPVHEAAELAAPTAVGPGYSREKALEAIRARCESCAAVTRYTQPRAMADATIRTLCQRLLYEGRPEWIVLMTLANLVMNYRMRLSREPPMTASRGQWQAIATEEMRREEQASDASPPMTEIAETLGMHLCFVTATIARFWGLEINQDTPDFDALEALLKTRYGYWDDDIEHRSYFIHFQAGPSTPAVDRYVAWSWVICRW